MPFTVKDATAKNKALKTAKQKRAWAKVANSVRAACIKKGGDEKKCDAQAILRANGVLKKQIEEGTGEGGGAPRTSSARFSKEKQEVAMNGDLFEIARTATEIGLALANDSGEMDPVTANEALGQMREQLKAHQPKAADVKVAERLRYPPYGITSFADLQTAEAADEAADEVRLLTMQFNEMVNNIMWSSEVADKGAAIRLLADEFIGLIEEAVEDGMSESSEPIDSSIGAILSETTVAEMGPEAMVTIAEDSGTGAVTARSPLLLDVVVIEPGWGNKKNNNYYPAEMLVREAHKFKGVKMYVTQHKKDEQNLRNDVSEILECPIGLTQTGGLIARVGVYDAQFAENTRNRAALGTLKNLHTSVFGVGAYKKGQIDGRKGNIIESFTHIGSTDWVTRGGAGGRALNIVESADGTEAGGEQMDEQEVKDNSTDTVTLKETVIEEKSQKDEQTDEQAVEEEKQEPEVTMLSETAVDEILANPGVNLPKISVTRLSERQYGDEQAVRDAVAAEVSYIKALTGSGKPQDLGSTQALEQTVMTEAEYADEFDKILTRHNMRSLSERMV